MDVLLNDLSAECSLAERGVAADVVDWRLLWLMGEEGGGGGDEVRMEELLAHNTLCRLAHCRMRALLMWLITGTPCKNLLSEHENVN